MICATCGKEEHEAEHKNCQVKANEEIYGRCGFIPKRGNIVFRSKGTCNPITSTRLFEAIAKLEKLRIGKDQMIILAPLDTFRKMLEESQDEGANLYLVCEKNPNRFSGVLFVEDEQITQVVIRSLASNHSVKV